MDVWDLSFMEVLWCLKENWCHFKNFFSRRENQIRNISIEQYERLESLFNDNEKFIADFEEIKLEIIVHLSILQTLIRQYLPFPDGQKDWSVTYSQLI